MLGARVFEKHVALNRSLKGTDHSFALEPHGFGNFVRDIRRVPEMLPKKNDDTLGNEEVFMKLGKSVVAMVDLEKGCELSVNNLSGKIFNSQYIPVRESINLLGKRLLRDVMKGESIKYDDIE